MFVVGVTGGIGSGKTTVTNMFSDLGVNIVDTDMIARQVVEPGTHCLNEIRERFGDTILLHDGSLDRKQLREIIFSDPQEKTWIESLLHPEIRKVTREQLINSSSVYTILSSPLLIESPDIDIVDRVVVVDVPENTQVSRTVSRDSVSEEQVRNTVAFQLSRDKRLARADDIIDNSGTLEQTRAQVEQLHDEFLRLADK